MESKKDLVQMIQAKMTSFLENSPVHDICKTGSAVAGVDKVVVFEAMIVAVLLLFVLIFGAEFVVDVACFVYPLLSSMSAVHNGDRASRAQWITYWMTLFSFQAVESMMPRLLSSIPFYFWVKLAFMVWCYHPVTKGAAVLYAILEPVRDEVMPLFDTLAGGIVPALSATSKPDADESSSRSSTDGQYIPTGITVHLTSLELKKTDSTADDEDAEESEPKAPKARYVEIFLGTVGKDGEQPKCVGAKYKTPPLTGDICSFDYTLTLIPPTDILNQTGATLCFIVKERMTFGDDPTLYEINSPIDISTLQSPGGKSRSRSPDSDGDLVSISVGRRPVLLDNEMGSIKGWIELISER